MIRFTIQNTNFWTFKLQRVRTFLAINILKRLPWPWPAIAHEKELLEETLSPIWSHVTSVSYLFDIFISVDYNSKAFWSHGYFFCSDTDICLHDTIQPYIYIYIFPFSVCKRLVVKIRVWHETHKRWLLIVIIIIIVLIIAFLYTFIYSTISSSLSCCLHNWHLVSSWQGK